MTPQTVLDFWFAEANRPFWFAKSDEFDQAIRSRFADLWQQAARAELYGWRATLEGRLAPKKPPNSPASPICPTHGGT